LGAERYSPLHNDALDIYYKKPEDLEKIKKERLEEKTNKD